jgi:outer membrane protein with beta-barrel domain
VKKIYRLLLLSSPLLLVQAAAAQSGFDVNMGFGSAHAKSSGDVFETFGDGVLYRTPSLNGFFLGFGGNLMLYKHLGFGAQVKMQPYRPDYAGLKSRTTFYDFNAIYQPFASSRASMQLQGGIGGTNMRFYLADTGCNGFTGCRSYTQFVDSSNHFQVHGGVGVQVFLTDRVFIRPQLDVHYVHNFFQFGTDFVPSAMVWVGYSFGDR